MALETLKGIEEVGGFKLVVMDELREKYPEKFIESGQMNWKWFETEIRPHHFVYIRNDKNSISFTLQSGPIKEVGVNGCQVDTIIETAKLMLEGLYKNLPSTETNNAIMHLDISLGWLKKRKQDREARGVEGTDQE